MVDETKQPSKSKSRLFSILLWLGITAVFVLMVGGFRVQYKGNQTHKFLFGLAQAGRGYLQSDWLANTKDPLPVFSFLVRVTYQYLDESLFYLYQFFLIGIYLFSIVGIVDHLYNLRRKKLLFFIFISIYLLSYSTYWPGTIPLTLYYGVAGQDFGFYSFLPNAFLAFLFLSIYQYLNKKPYWAIASIAIACYFHTGYLIGGAALVMAYLIIDYFENKDLTRVIKYGVLSFVLILPIVVYSALLNQNSTVEQVNQATSIMVNQLIPQHTLVTHWWDEFAFYKLLIMMAAILVSRRTKLFPILSISLLIIAVPSILLYYRPSNTIAFLQLWRVSTLAVPLASTVLVASGLNNLYSLEEKFINRWKLLIILLLSLVLIINSVYGVNAQIENIQQKHNQSERELMDFVESTADAGQLYLVPPTDHLLVSFRTHTGLPILIHDSAHVYNAVEVLEWDRRYKLATGFYNSEGQDRCSRLVELSEEFGITHVVTYSKNELTCDGLPQIYQNERYLIYQIIP
jgi:flagellar basal body-associated protein FliL